MRRAVLLILGLCFLTSLTRPGFSEKPLRLYFEKNIPAETESEQDHRHTVQQGEWLFKILAAKGYTVADMPKVISLIRAMNPHIPDINHLRPGQVLQLPEPSRVSHLVSTAAQVNQDDYTAIPYVIQPGDTLVQVLQAHGVPSTMIFSQYMNLFLTLNPDVPDTNTLRVGQEVTLPVVKGAVEQRPPLIPPPVILRPELGRTIAGQDFSPTGQGGAPDGQGSAGEASANATQGTFSMSESGQSPRQPAPFSVAPATRMTAVLESNATAPDIKPERTPRLGLPLVRSILQQMQFAFTPGDEVMYPLPGGDWLHVKLFETPLLTAPWGEKILLCPVPKTEQWLSKAQTLGMTVCAVSPRWSVQDVLEKLAAASPKHLRLWDPSRELVLSRGDIGLTLQAPQLTIMDHRGQKTIHIIWQRPSPDSPPLPQGLPEVVEPAQVKIIEMDAFNELSRLPSRPRESIYMPAATHMDIVQAMNPDSPEEFFGPRLPESMTSLLQQLKEKDVLRQGRVHVAWSAGPQTRIALQVPAWTIATGSNKIALLDSRFADEYLIALLAYEGYACFILPD